MELVNLLKEVMSLTTSVGELKGDVDRLFDKVENHAKRIVRLESREELLSAKMANEAIKAVYQMNEKLLARLAVLENQTGIQQSESAALLSRPQPRT